jgi:hypothetical protein
MLKSRFVHISSRLGGMSYGAHCIWFGAQHEAALEPSIYMGIGKEVSGVRKIPLSNF